MSVSKFLEWDFLMVGSGEGIRGVDKREIRSVTSLQYRGQRSTLCQVTSLVWGMFREGALVGCGGSACLVGLERAWWWF